MIKNDIQLKAIQDIQDAYATLLGLSIFITDSNGLPVTKVSGISPLIQHVFTKNSLLESMSRTIQINKLISHDSNLVVKEMIDNHCTWLYTSIKNNGKPLYYIWAGAFIYEAKVEELKKQNAEIYHLVSSENIKSHQQIHEVFLSLTKLSNICSQLFITKQQIELTAATNKVLLGAAHTIEKPDSCLKSTLIRLLELFHNVDVVAYASKKAGSIVIQESLWNQSTDLNGCKIKIEHSYFKTIVEEKAASFWEDIEFDPRSYSLAAHGLQLKSLYCYPIFAEYDSAVKGVIFLGSSTDKEIDLNLFNSGKLIASLFRTQLMNKNLQHSLDQHLMRLSTIMEVSKAMSLLEDEKEILFMLADLLSNLVPSHFTLVGLKNGHLEINQLTDMISNEALHSYSEEVVKDHFNTNKVSPLLHTTYQKKEWGTVLECPIILNQRVEGVLCTALQTDKNLKEFDTYLTTLSSMGTMALSQLYNKQLNKGENESAESEVSASKAIESERLTNLLTNREIEVMKQVMHGLSNKEIADKLFISVHTVKNHITKIFQKLGVTDRSQMIAMIYQFSNPKSLGAEPN